MTSIENFLKFVEGQGIRISAKHDHRRRAVKRVHPGSVILPRAKIPKRFGAVLISPTQSYFGIKGLTEPTVTDASAVHFVRRCGAASTLQSPGPAIEAQSATQRRPEASRPPRLPPVVSYSAVVNRRSFCIARFENLDDPGPCRSVFDLHEAP
ncbi:hypothetical protein [uncultured Jannaschia sp.]|uniref:hypothetical protein n=1 Tax=uncultured Jannaschia sp. TaxID=293347 RepID=UPI00263581A9|nr:hypothetical protein [uncultured Jannaschia sp.]